MERITYIVVFVALVAAFMVLLVKKWGIAEWMQVHGDRVISQLFSCDFCMSFWSAIVILAFLAGYTDDGWLLLLACCTTPITRMLV